MNNLPAHPVRQNIDALQNAMAQLPQLEMETRHYFADGMYCRELFIPAGSVLVGKVHKTEHFFLLTKGRLRVVSEFGEHELEAPAVLVSPPGIKRAGFAISDVVCCNVHRTFKTDLDELEADLIEPEGPKLFDARNKLIARES